MRIAEIFASVQGEGLRQGEPTIFVRLAGCNLRCAFCDTKRAWTGGREWTAAQICDRVGVLGRGFPAQWVSLTGGEPLLQDLSELAGGLKARGFKVQVETNGTLFQRAPFDWVTLSPKPKDYVHRPEWRARAKEVKLVVTEALTYPVLRRIRGEFPRDVPILLQPCSNRKDSRARAIRLLRKAARDGLLNIRLTLQLHKIYGLR